ncbi:MAG: Nramp family divalent metal transporter [Planctomycetota bacterium]
MGETSRLSPFAIIGPGLLVAATGVGAGDLATGALVGGALGVAVIWAVVLGAGLKFVLNEGLARYQLATGRTLIEGAVRHGGMPLVVLFVPYFLLWCVLVGGALISACGVTTHALIPVFADAATGKVVWGYICSGVALALVLLGGYRFIERFMGACVGVMFVTVLITATQLPVDWANVLAGTFIPRIPDAANAVYQTVSLMGGVGGTLTVLCYGYWIREEGRGRRVGETGDEVEAKARRDLRICRIDLGVAYAVTGLFGIAMVMIGSNVAGIGSGGGSALIVKLAARLREMLGDVAYWIFLVGAFGAVFSSLIGVLQAVPYLAVDLAALLRRRMQHADDDSPIEVRTQSWTYRGFAIGLAIVPSVLLFTGFARIQKLYAFVGALFIPVLALGLLIINSRSAWVGASWRNRPLTISVLVATLAFFAALLMVDMLA